MLPNIQYVLLCALKDRLFYGLILLTLSIAALSSMLGHTSFIEEMEMTVVFAAGASRLVLVIASIVFVCFFIHSSFDHKHMDVMMSRPVSRDEVVLSHWLGFALITMVMVLAVTACLFLIGPANHAGLLPWTVSMIWELWMVVAFALFASLILSSAVISVLASLAFYVAARMMILFIMTAERTANEILGTREILEWLAVFMPRLDLFVHSEWLVYGWEEKYSLTLLASQTLLFVTLLLTLCMSDFRKRQF